MGALACYGRTLSSNLSAMQVRTGSARQVYRSPVRKAQLRRLVQCKPCFEDVFHGLTLSMRNIVHSFMLVCTECFVLIELDADVWSQLYQLVQQLDAAADNATWSACSCVSLDLLYAEVQTWTAGKSTLRSGRHEFDNQMRS